MFNMKTILARACAALYVETLSQIEGADRAPENKSVTALLSLTLDDSDMLMFFGEGYVSADKKLCEDFVSISDERIITGLLNCIAVSLRALRVLNRENIELCSADTFDDFLRAAETLFKHDKGSDHADVVFEMLSMYSTDTWVSQFKNYPEKFRSPLGLALCKKAAEISNGRIQTIELDERVMQQAAASSAFH